MNAAQQIVNKLVDLFAQYDADILENSKKWAQGRMNALQEFKYSEEAKQLRKDQWKYYDRVHAIAGGKTWYNIFTGRNWDMVSEIVEKNCANTIEKRNNSIASKLEKAGVTEVISEEYVNTTDGFNGVFIVNTNQGRKRVSIETIVAGGYNIQCMHMRVLVKVK